MNNDHKISLPNPYASKQSKIHASLDFFTKDNPIRMWRGYIIFDMLFFAYLFSKYKNTCYTYKTPYKRAGGILGVFIDIDPDRTSEETKEYRKYQKELAEELTKCIKSTKKVLVIPVTIDTGKMRHANLFIYRKNRHEIERFEPHGDMFRTKSDTNDEDRRVTRDINELVRLINLELKKHKDEYIYFRNASDICPYQGLQTLEESAGMKNKQIEGGGYCAAWSMFFAELALKNPELTSMDLLTIITRKIGTNQGGNYLRKVIIGYINYIYNKINKYFSTLFKQRITVENIDKLSDAQLDKVIKQVYMLATMELDLIITGMKQYEYVMFISDVIFDGQGDYAEDDIRNDPEYLEFIKYHNKIAFSPITASSKSSPVYVPGSKSPVYVPGSQSPVYNPGSPVYVPGSPMYVPGSQSPVYNADSPVYIPGSQSPSYRYSPPEKTAKTAHSISNKYKGTKHVFSSVKRRQTKKHRK